MALTKVTSGVRTLATDEVGATEIAAGAVGASEVASTFDISSKTVTLPAASVTAHAPSTSGLEEDIALLGFRVASNGSLAKYNLVDQTEDAFEDTSGVDASASTNDVRSDSNFYSGGVVTRTSFTSTGSDTYTTPAALVGKVEVLVVAGGGAGMGGGNGGGAGGAGGLVYVNEYTAAASTTYNLTIGAGGVGRAAANTGLNGDDSVFDTSGTSTTLTASGGGGAPEAITAVPGGSGGGGYSATGDKHSGGVSDQVATFGSYSNVGFGSAGGDAFTSGTGAGGGGGGGAGAVGNQGVPQGTGDGGIGKAYTIADGTTSVYYAGGGGGGVTTGTTVGAGGLGGGGKGGFGTGPSYTEPVAGTANTGGGGGGGRNDGGGASGGSGIIIVVHRIPGDMTLVSNATTAEAAPTKGDIVFTYSDGVGTAVVGTDITAEYSADNGSNWTPFGIGTSDVQGTTGEHTIVSKHDVALTSASGTAMKYRIKTLNQSATKETRIHAVSLGWS